MTFQVTPFGVDFRMNFVFQSMVHFLFIFYVSIKSLQGFTSFTLTSVLRDSDLLRQGASKDCFEKFYKRVNLLITFYSFCHNVSTH